MAANGLEHRDDVAATRARTNGAAVHEHGRPVQARDGHGATWHVLVTAADGHQAVKALGTDHGLDGIGDDFARNKRIAHAGRAHGDAVGHGDGVEQDRFAAGRVSTGCRFFGQFADVHVAGGQRGPGGGDADLRLGKIGVLETDGAQHGARGRLLDAIHHEAGVLAGVVGLGSLALGHGSAFIVRGDLCAPLSSD